MKNILITGGSGFIARNLAEQLSNNYNIIAVGRKDLDLINSQDVLNFLKKNNFDVVIYTANYDAVHPKYKKDPKFVLENNLKMFFNVARCDGYFEKMIYFGSGAEFGRENWIPKMRENYFDEHVPDDQYGFSKYLMTKYTLLNKSIYNLRLFATFGKYEDWEIRLISNLCYRSIINLPLEINQNKYYDFMYVNDLSMIVEWFIENEPKEKVYNVCSGEIIDFETIANKIRQISRKESEIKIKKEGLGEEYSGDNALLLNELKDFHFTQIDISLKQLYEWYKQNRPWENKDELRKQNQT